MKTPDAVKKKIADAFDAAGLLQYLELGSSSFRELPRLFEASHFAVRLSLNDLSAVSAASGIAAKLKRDLERQGIELDYAINPMWTVSKFSSTALQRGRAGEWLPAESFSVELQSGSARRLVTVCLSPEAAEEVRGYLERIAIAEQESAVYRMLTACLNRQLASIELGRWDPVLYPNRTISAEEILEVVRHCPAASESELQPQLS
jgi:hypothetical protein